MKRKSFLITVSGIALALVGLAGATALHAAGPASRGARLGRGAGTAGAAGTERPLAALREEMNVTPEQRQEIRKVLVAHRDELAAVARPLVEAHRALRQAVLAEQPDDAAIRSASEGLGKAVGDAAVLAAKLKPELKGVLTAEQIKTLGEAGDKMEMRVDSFLDRLENAGK